VRAGSRGWRRQCDGKISIKDKIFPSLRLWYDWNHDGIAEDNEVFALPPDLEIRLDYKPSKRVDAFGNLFEFWTVITGERDKKAVDILFAVE